MSFWWMYMQTPTQSALFLSPYVLCLHYVFIKSLWWCHSSGQCYSCAASLIIRGLQSGTLWHCRGSLQKARVKHPSLPLSDGPSLSLWVCSQTCGFQLNIYLREFHRVTSWSQPGSRGGAQLSTTVVSGDTKTAQTEIRAVLAKSGIPQLDLNIINHLTSTRSQEALFRVIVGFMLDNRKTVKNCMMLRFQ